MLKRNEKGKLVLNTLDLQVFLGDLFYMCKTEKEVSFLLENIIECTECIAEEVIEEKGLE